MTPFQLIRGGNVGPAGEQVHLVIEDIEHPKHVAPGCVLDHLSVAGATAETAEGANEIVHRDTEARKTLDHAHTRQTWIRRLGEAQAMLLDLSYTGALGGSDSSQIIRGR